ncbi:DUF1080 domain-containing protein [Niabella beijingensis]|uniref:DUF1080 domain-containing protein n=1 Tax=Niabella beijingensis TaxID=2872700 RepID=UPI001CC02C68|nr:DUF1080 domain-containing protein [Niabella beijingensis]MBZ4189334.1 DUF1080 domain-containing protein [Niabella beijingensis]
MEKLISGLVLTLLFSSLELFAQSVKLGQYTLTVNKISVSKVKIMGKDAVRVVKDSSIKAVDEPTFARLTGVHFKNGTIEVKVLSRLLPNAPEFARGFIGIAFHINDSNTRYESIYLRPTNGRADDQVRRNHSVQYYAYPDYKFDRLRKESPERYESYADMALNQWITMRIEVTGEQARLFLNGSKQPTLVVNDPKLGPGATGAIGLWVDVGTEGFFSDLNVLKQK